MAQPLSPNEIRDRALKFAREWEGVTNERAEAQSFWNDFFDVFGISRRRVATFEEFVRPIRKKWEEGDLFAKPGRPAGSGFIDLLWKGMLIAEHKSLGKDLDSAYVQALLGGGRLSIPLSLCCNQLQRQETVTKDSYKGPPKGPLNC